jgi:hypothetical protein
MNLEDAPPFCFGGASVVRRQKPMCEKVVSSVDEYLAAILPFQQKAFAQIHRFGSERPAILFRGQKAEVPLVAKIGKVVEDNNIERPLTFERNRLRIAQTILGVHGKYTEWDLVALSQHHGIETRFLDWTSNSLVALWFAINDKDHHCGVRDSVVWILETVERDFLIPEDETSPIPDKKGSQTVIFTPDLIDSRISAQDSYLMRQVYEKLSDKKLKIRPVDNNPTFKGRLHKIKISCSVQDIQTMIDDLRKYGYTKESLIPDSIWDRIKECSDRLVKDYSQKDKASK